MQILGQVFKDLYKKEGLIGLYKGYPASLILCSLGIIQMVCYEILKQTTQKINLQENVKTFLNGSISRFIASTLLYPVATTRTRIQKRQFTLSELNKSKNGGKEILYDNVFDCFVKIWRGEGLRGFYKGYAPTIIKAIPSQGLFFVIYEHTLRLLAKYENIS